MMIYICVLGKIYVVPGCSVQIQMVRVHYVCVWDHKKSDLSLKPTTGDGKLQLVFLS